MKRIDELYRFIGKRLTTNVSVRVEHFLQNLDEGGFYLLLYHIGAFYLNGQSIDIDKLILLFLQDYLWNFYNIKAEIKDEYIELDRLPNPKDKILQDALEAIFIKVKNQTGGVR